MADERTLARKERSGLEPYEPWNSFREMERMFKDFFTTPLPLLGRRLMAPELRHELMPEVDLRETDRELILSASVPGLERDDIDINVTEDRITISGERKIDEEKQGEYHVRQQSYGTFRVSYVLPVIVKPDDVKATYKNGVLEVVMPKSEVVEEHKVRVEVQD